MPRFVDLVGRRFGLLVVVKLAPKSSGGRTQWLCRCDCGSDVVAIGQHLTRPLIPKAHCGCGDQRGVHFRVHGESHMANGKPSPTYSTWKAMHKRCTNPTDDQYANYGGRGITVCDRWSGASGYVHFMEDMGEKPLGHSIDRERNQEGYKPDNCRWATATEQSRNRRNVTMTHDRIDEACGRREHGQSVHSIANLMGVGATTIRRWLETGGCDAL